MQLAGHDMAHSVAARVASPLPSPGKVRALAILPPAGGGLLTAQVIKCRDTDTK